MITDRQFQNLMDHYHETFIQWHRYVTKYIRIDREHFLSEFQYILFQTMVHFDKNKAMSETNRFERYFASSLKKMTNTLMRRASTKKRKIERKSISFCVKKHDIADTRCVKPIDSMVMNEYLKYCGPLEPVIRLRVDGNSMDEICKQTGLQSHQYRNIMKKVKAKDSLLRVLSRD